MLTFTKLTDSQAVHGVYTEDQPALAKNPNYDPVDPESPDAFDEFEPVYDYDPQTGTLIERQSCTKTLVINKNGEVITTSNWFITRKNNELIYDVDKNDWVNLDLFDQNKSVCTEIYHITVN